MGVESEVTSAYEAIEGGVGPDIGGVGGPSSGNGIRGLGLGLIPGSPDQ